jgi:hypothetical protein
MKILKNIVLVMLISAFSVQTCHTELFNHEINKRPKSTEIIEIPQKHRRKPMSMNYSNVRGF